MWSFDIGIGILAFSLNLFVACTWALGGKRILANTLYQLKICVSCGLLYGLVVPLPTLILKYELPCNNETEEGWGTSPICAINRSGMYLLLCMMVHLCVLTIKLFHTLKSSQHVQFHKLSNVATVFPFVLMRAAFVEGEEEVENKQLNIARHAFSCSMRCLT